MLTLIGTGKSRAFRVLWMLEELGLEYEHIPAGPRSAEILSHNHLGKIPALRDGDDTLTDSVAIMTYLADKYGGLTAPAGTPARGLQDATTLWLIDEFDALLWSMAKYTRLYPEDMRLPDIGETLKTEFAWNLGKLSERLEGRAFLMGDAFSLPDILAVHCLGWGKIAGFPAHPDRVAAYVDSARARPAYLAAQARIKAEA